VKFIEAVARMASDILDRILLVKRAEIAAAREKNELAAVRRQALSAPPVRDFVGAMRARNAAGQPAVIAEIKREKLSCARRIPEWPWIIYLKQ